MAAGMWLHWALGDKGGLRWCACKWEWPLSGGCRYCSRARGIHPIFWDSRQLKCEGLNLRAMTRRRRMA